MGHLLHELPSTLGITRLWRALHTSSIPVLLLHGVLPGADASPFNSTGKFISPERLRCFLEKVACIFKVSSADEVIRDLAAGDRISNTMVITFDDGYANTYTHAFPLLRQMALPFSVFITTGFVDSARVLWNDLLEFAVHTTEESVIPAGVLPRDMPIGSTDERRVAIAAIKDVLKSTTLSEAWDQVEVISDRLGVDRGSCELDNVRFLTSRQIKDLADEGVSICGHTVTHPILSRESPERVRAEVRECKRRLEEITGKPVRHFAYPNGRRQDYSDMVIKELKDAGYTAAFTSIHGLHRPGGDLFEIKRISLLNRWTYAEFETHASGILGVFRR